MTTFGASLVLAATISALAQESPNESTSPTASPTPVPTATATAARAVRISFVPPPLEGKISLGVYDASGKLVRVLHQEAGMDEFAVGPDALMTKWDGRDDEGRDLPPGKYTAHGYVVGPVENEKLDGPDETAAPTPGSNEKVKIKLMTNPLVKNDRPTLEVSVGFDDQSSFLKTGDDLPLYTISEGANVTEALLIKNADKSVEIWQADNKGSEHFRISHLDKIMAFDCGGFELK